MVTMRPTILSLFLLFTVPSMAQQGSASDSLVCFTMEEAALIHDTLWSGINHRRARVIMAAMIGNLEQRLESAEAREAQERSRADRLAKSEGAAYTEVDQLKKDVAFWKKKSKRSFWWGFGLGNVTGGGAGYGANELKP